MHHRTQRQRLPLHDRIILRTQSGPLLVAMLEQIVNISKQRIHLRPDVIGFRLESFILVLVIGKHLVSVVTVHHIIILCHHINNPHAQIIPVHVNHPHIHPVQGSHKPVVRREESILHDLVAHLHVQPIGTRSRRHRQNTGHRQHLKYPFYLHNYKLIKN